MKKMLAAMLAAVMLCGLSACASQDGSSADSNEAEIAENITDAAGEIPEGMEGMPDEPIGFTDIQLIYLSKNYYSAKNGKDADFAEIDTEDDGTVIIHLFNREGGEPITCDKYYIDRMTGEGKNEQGEKVNLKKTPD